MGNMRMVQNINKIQGEKHYVLLMVSTNEVDQARSWLQHVSSSLDLKEIFVGDITGITALEQPVGLVALLRFDSVAEMRATITEVSSELRQRDSWTFDFMKATWMDIQPSSTARVQNGDRRLVTTDGRICFRNRRYYISGRLRGEYVELGVDDENLNVYHNGVLIKALKVRT